jgi:hypothetical protein
VGDWHFEVCRGRRRAADCIFLDGVPVPRSDVFYHLQKQEYARFESPQIHPSEDRAKYTSNILHPHQASHPVHASQRRKLTSDRPHKIDTTSPTDNTPTVLLSAHRIGPRASPCLFAYPRRFHAAGRVVAICIVRLVTSSGAHIASPLPKKSSSTPRDETGAIIMLTGLCPAVAIGLDTEGQCGTANPFQAMKFTVGMAGFPLDG